MHGDGRMADGLVLTRSPGEGFWIGDEIYVEYASKGAGDRVKIRIRAPKRYEVARNELGTPTPVEPGDVALLRQRLEYLEGLLERYRSPDRYSQAAYNLTTEDLKIAAEIARAEAQQAIDDAAAIAESINDPEGGGLPS